MGQARGIRSGDPDRAFLLAQGESPHPGNRSGARRRLCIAAALAEAIEEVKAAAHLPPQSKKAESGREKAILRVVHMPVPVIPLLTNIFTSTLRF